MKRFLFIALLFSAYLAQSQEKFHLQGIIFNENKQPLSGVNIYLKSDLNKGVSTDEKGWFDLVLPSGKHTILINYMGYQKQAYTFDLKKDKYLEIKLKPQNNQLNEVVFEIKETNKKALKKYIGQHKISIKKMTQLPMLLGEKDVLKAVQILPGVKATSEGSAGFSVHGGSIDQNLILLDGAPIYHPSHLLGFFSVFIPDMIQDLQLYKSSIPATYGNRLSSILKVNTRIGNVEKYHFGGSIGMISSQLFAEGPIQKQQSSFLIAARQSYADIWLPLFDFEDLNDAESNFYDLNLKLYFKLSQKSNLQINAYNGRDYFSPYPHFKMNYGNRIGSLTFSHFYNATFTSKTSLSTSKYDYEISLKDNIDHQDYNFAISLAIETQNLKQNFTYQPNLKNRFDFGFDTYYHTIKPGNLKNNISGQAVNNDFPDRHAGELDFFLQHLVKIGKKINLSYGMRTSIFARLGKETFYRFNELGETIDTLYAGKYESVKTFYKWAPRIAINWQVVPKTAIKLSYDKTYQFLHYLINDATTTPTDLWLPSGINLKPQSSDSYSFEISQSIGKKYYMSIGSYYRDLQHITDYKIGTSLSLSPMIESDLLQGKGRAYGIEFLFKKEIGKLTGFLAYTYSKTEKIYPEINEGKWYPAAVDHPNDITALLSYKLSDRAQISAMWVYYNGRPITFPAGTYQIDVHDILYFSHRNANRLPDYHRLDVSFTLKNKKYKYINGKAIKKKIESYWNFSIYNAYMQDNTYMVRFKYDEPTETIDAYKITLFKIVPSISYHFKF